jgi:arylsulfatase A-like enzyme
VRLSRRPFLVLTAVAAAAALALLLPRVAAFELHRTTGIGERTVHANLILIIIDTLREDAFRSVVSETREGSDFLQEVDGAAWFRHAVAAAPWTAPSVASIMTGLYPREHGLVQEPRPSESEWPRPMRQLSRTARTIAETLHEQGYSTRAIVANPQLGRTSGIARGVEEYEMLRCRATDLAVLSTLSELGLPGCRAYEDAEAVRRALDIRIPALRAAPGPFFLWLHLMDPHDPLFAHAGLSSDPAAGNLPELERLYRDEVRYTLKELTLMMRRLKEADLWSNSLVMILSDHGEMFPSDGHSTDVIAFDGFSKTYGHGHVMYRELVRVPLVIRPPGGLPETRTLQALVSLVDLPLTVYDLLDLEPPRMGPDRTSAGAWLTAGPEEPTGSGRTFAYSSSNNLGPEQKAIRTSSFKLIVYPNGERTSELYDLEADPWEGLDIGPERPGQLEEAKAVLNRFLASLGDRPATAPVPQDAEQIERLRALGYIK